MSRSRLNFATKDIEPHCCDEVKALQFAVLYVLFRVSVHLLSQCDSRFVVTFNWRTTQTCRLTFLSSFLWFPRPWLGGGVGERGGGGGNWASACRPFYSRF